MPSSDDAQGAVEDPWRITPDRLVRPLPVAAVLALALALGAVAPMWNLWSLGREQRLGALVVAAVVVAVVLWRIGSPRAAGWGWLAISVTIGVGTVLTTRSLGVAFVPLSAAAAAATTWCVTPPLQRRADTRGPAVVGLGLGALVLSAAARARGAPNLLPAALIGLAAVVLLMDRWRPRWSAAMHTGIERAVGAVLTLVAAVALFVVSLVALYLPGAVGRIVHRLRRALSASGPSYWELPPADADTMRRLARQPFAATAPRLRRRRLLGAVAAMAILTLGTATVVQLRSTPQVRTWSDGPTPAVDATALAAGTAALEQLEAIPYSLRPAFAGDDFADAMQAELRSYQFIDDDATGYRNQEFRGLYTNVDAQGRRRTISSACSDCPTARVWLLGGSTVFGLGQRDEHTIASELVRAGDRAGISLEVQNLGVAGWTVEQEVDDLERRLRKADEPPDLVVFIDGFNDTAASIFDAAFGRTEDTGVLRAEDSAQILGGGGKVLDAAASREAGLTAARRYRRAQVRAVQLAARHGADTRSFFQPDAFANERQRAFLLDYYSFAPGLLERFDLGAALDAAAAELEPDTSSLRELFDEQDAPVFVDMVHLNEAAAAVVAQAVFDSIHPALRTRQR